MVLPPPEGGTIVDGEYLDVECPGTGEPGWREAGGKFRTLNVCGVEVVGGCEVGMAGGCGLRVIDGCGEVKVVACCAVEVDC